MNKIMKYCSISLLTLSPFHFIEKAFAADCKTPPDCYAVGYTKKLSECPNGHIKCPWDTTKIYCPPSADNSISCEAGSVLYENLRCYMMGTTSKLPIAVVVDSESGLAIALDETTTRWGVLGFDIPDLGNCTSSYGRKCYGFGSKNTQVIMKLSNASEYKAAYYSANYSTVGTKVGDWFLPSSYELGNLAINLRPVNLGVNNVMGTPISGVYWSSTEYGEAGAWLYITSGNSDMNTSKGDSHSVRPFINYLNPGHIDDGS